MHLLHRSSKRLLLNRHLADFARLALHPLHDRPHLEGDLAGNSSIKRFLVFFEDRFHYQGLRPLPPFSPHVAVCHKSNCRQEVEYFACEESVVSEADHSASSHASNSRLAFCKKRSDFVLAKSELERDPKDTGSYKGAFLDLPVAESGTASTRTCKLKKQHDNELADGCKFSKSRGFGIYSCKAFLQIVKRDFHTLRVSIVDSRMRSASMNERRQADADGEFEVDAKEIPQNNTDERIEKQALKSTSDNIENLEVGFHREDKEAVMSQKQLFVKGNISLLEEKDKEEKFNDVISLHHGDIALKFAASSTKKRGRVPRPCERGYFTVLAKKKKNRRKRKNKKSWDAEMQLRPDELKKLRVAPPLDQIAAAGTGFFVEKPRMHGKANVPNYNLIMSKFITPVLHQESSGLADLVDTNSLKMIKESKNNNLAQEVRKQFNCVELSEEENASQDLVLDEELITNKHAKSSKGFFCEKGSSKLKEVSKDLGVNDEVFLMQESSREMEPKMIGKAKGICNKDDTSFCYQNRGNLIVYDDFKASTSSDFYSKGWMTAHEETLAKGVDGDVCHKAGASKVRYPLGNLSLNHVYVILDLNGVLIKRWDVNPSLPGVSKLNKRWIQLRPGCIEFLCQAFSKFKVGIWSTMTQKNVVGVCKLLEQQAHQSLPFFMVWSKDSCYQQIGVRRPDKSHVLADFKPLSHVWRFFEPYIGFHNTVLIDDSPYKACMNHRYNCIFPDAYEGCTDDDYLTHVLWPYLEKMRLSQNLQAYIANNPLGQQPIVVGHKLYYHVQQVMDNFGHHIHPSGTGELIGKVESFKL